MMKRSVSVTWGPLKNSGIRPIPVLSFDWSPQNSPSIQMVNPDASDTRRYLENSWGAHSLLLAIPLAVPLAAGLTSEL